VNWRDIKTAPKDKTLVWVTAAEAGEFLMYWDPDFVTRFIGPGCWVAPDESFTWDASRGAGPTHWRPRVLH